MNAIVSAASSKKLAGKVAIVTGGSRGMGTAIVKRLAAEGADLAFNYLSSPERAQAVVRELEAAGVRVAALQVDQGDAAQVANFVRTVTARFGRLDILVNNAGVLVVGRVSDSAGDAAKFDRQFAVNVGGVAAAVRAASGVLSDGGRIINIGSS